MSRVYNPKKQFELTPEEFLKKLDLLNWYRYFYLMKELVRVRPQSILEVGPGEGTIKRLMGPFVPNYETLDVNPKLAPTYIGDVQKRQEHLEKKYDCVIAADVLEHIPFEELENALGNLCSYLKGGGFALLTIPHRSHYFFWMTSLRHRPFIMRLPTLKRLFGKAWIDPDHQWEIGDGKHTVKDVVAVLRRAGFTIQKIKKLLYVDFFILSA